MKRVLIILIFFVFLVNPVVLASELPASQYVLPYPSFMPGSKFYMVSSYWDEIMSYWYFGALAQFSYNLSQSDKYLVEAKTLFEYKQYLLGYNSLQKSNSYFKKAEQSLALAQKEQKSIQEKNYLFAQAALKHTEILSALSTIVPSTFVWSPEKEKPQALELEKLIQESVFIRSNIYEKVSK